MLKIQNIYFILIDIPEEKKKGNLMLIRLPKSLFYINWFPRRKKKKKKKEI